MTQSQVCNEVLTDLGPDAADLELYILALESERDALAAHLAALRESLKRIEHATACSNAGKAYRIARNALNEEAPQ